MKNTKNILFLIPFIALVLSGCGPKVEVVITTDQDASSLLMTDVPESVPGLIEAIAASQPGEAFHFTGRVGGLREPLTEGYAAFVVADESIVFCDEISDDNHCATPWDACCEDPDKIAKSRAFVQFVGSDGLPLTVDLSEAVGLDANDNVTVLGRLSLESTPGNPIIFADRIAITE